MARVGIVFGLFLCGLTVLGMMGTEIKSPTQFYPMMLGIPILFCGVVALNPHRRKHAMHVTSAIALAGTLAGGAGSLFWMIQTFRGREVDRYGLALTIAMSMTCLVLLAICVASFILVRRRKRAMEQDPRVELRRPASNPTAVADASSRETA